MGIKARLGVGSQRRGEKREQGKISQVMEIHGFPPRPSSFPSPASAGRERGLKEMEGTSGEERFLNPDGSSGEEESGGGGGRLSTESALLPTDH